MCVHILCVHFVACIILSSQLFIGDQHSLKYKFRSWYGNVWNRFDAAMYVLFILSIILRYQLSEENFVGARITYSITLAMFFLRFMQFFYVEKNMGPKVIMIRKMVCLSDVLFLQTSPCSVFRLLTLAFTA